MQNTANLPAPTNPDEEFAPNLMESMEVCFESNPAKRSVKQLLTLLSCAQKWNYTSYFGLLRSLFETTVVTPVTFNQVVGAILQNLIRTEAHEEYPQIWLTLS